MATIVVNKYTDEPITWLSRFGEIQKCSKCNAGTGNIRPQYVSEKAARDQYGVEHELLRVECTNCQYEIALMPCADAKKES